MFWCCFHIQDLESQTDENTTPVGKQNSSKRASDVDHESDGSSMKKQILDIKIEKEAVDHESDGASLKKQIQDSEIEKEAAKWRSIGHNK